MKIAKILARQILDSRGNPTVESDVILQNGIMGRASVPSGASKGTNEATELRDNNKIYNGKSVLKAVDNIETKISSSIVGLDIEDQKGLDQAMIDCDGTQNKTKLGANAILAVSLASSKAAAIYTQKNLFEYFSSLSEGKGDYQLPIPLMNVINGGAHAQNSTDIQEFMIMPKGAKTFSDALRMGVEVFHALREILTKSGFTTAVGDEGGFPLSFKKNLLNSNAKALEIISNAIEKAGYQVGKDIVFALDIAASEFYKDGKYFLKREGSVFTTNQMINFLKSLVEKYPIVSIEDGLSENDWAGWAKLTKILGDRVQLVGDDLLVTNTKFLAKAVEKGCGNAILVKPNQVGTLTETIQAIDLAKKSGWKAIVSHRSGETEDTTIADLSVGLSTGQIKCGSLSRTDRIAKYNQLLRIEEILKKDAKYSKYKIWHT